MDLMTLAAKITLDDSSYTKGINNAESMGQKLQGRMSAMTVAVGNLAADMIRKGVSGVQQIIGGAMDGFADYQQLIGGVETLFKTSSTKVANYAKQSFKTTGLSANQYMETVTSFSASLLQGLGGDTEAAADLANTAVTDMADNANKMGTDISSIQAAYQGFAKQNYTMLDNLKLGYGGTASEMVRLINDSKILDHQIENLDGITFDQIIQAIHEMQTQLGVTGTTAKEAADTISGSKASLTAAWEDLLSAIGGEGSQERLDETLANFQTAFEGYMKNFIPTLLTTIGNSGTLVGGIADAIANLPTELLTKVSEEGLGAGTQMIGGITKITGWLIDSIAEAFRSASLDNSKVVEFGTAIGDFIGTAISGIVTNAGTIFEGIVSVGMGLAEGLVRGLVDGLFGEGAYGQIVDAEKEANKEILKAAEDSTKAQGILDYMLKLTEQYGNAAKVSWEWVEAAKALDEVMPGMSGWLEDQTGKLSDAIKNMKEYVKEQEKLIVAEAKQQALETKRQALIDARAAEFSAESEISIKQSEANQALQSMIEFIQLNGNKNFTGEGMTWDQIRSYAYDYLNKNIGAGNEGYTESATNLEAWSKVLETSESEIQQLKDSLPGLKQQVQFAETAFLTSSAAIDELSGAAGSAARALQAIKTPSVTYSSGQYYNWYYGGGAGHAKGLWDVPYDGYQAILHRGERVLTASQARKESSSGFDLSGMYEIVESAIRDGMSSVSVNSYLSSRNVTDDVSRNMARDLKARRFRP